MVFGVVSTCRIAWRSAEQRSTKSGLAKAAATRKKSLPPAADFGLFDRFRSRLCGLLLAFFSILFPAGLDLKPAKNQPSKINHPCSIKKADEVVNIEQIALLQSMLNYDKTQAVSKTGKNHEIKLL